MTLRSVTRTPRGEAPDVGVPVEAAVLVAFFHHCSFATSSTHGSDAGVRAAVAPLFDEFSVDLALQGHNHQYERSCRRRR